MNYRFLRIIFFGTPDYVVPVAEKLSANFNLVGIVTAADKFQGRKQVLTPSPVKFAFRNLINLTIITDEKLADQLGQKLKNLRPDLFMVASYGQIIPQEILDIPKFGALNIHPSILPKYRGASPIPAAILNGDKLSGVTIIKMDEKMDHGPIIYTKYTRLSDQDTFETLSNKMFNLGVDILVKIIPDFVQGKISPKPQDESKASYCKRIKKEDGYIDITTSADPKIFDRMIRAYYPWPGVWTLWSPDKTHDKKIVKFYPQGIVQMEGKKPTTLENFLHGYPDFPIKTLA